MTFLFCRFNKTINILQAAAKNFETDSAAFFNALRDVGKVNLDQRVIAVAKKINQGKTVRYCGIPLSEFPTAYAYLQEKSRDCVERIDNLVKSLIAADRNSASSLDVFRCQALEDMRAINFGLYEAPVIEACADEAQGLVERDIGSDDPCFFVALPALITLRLLARGNPFTELNCPEIFSGTAELSEMAVEEGYENTKTGLIEYLNAIRIKLSPISDSLREEIYQNLSDENANYSENCKLLYRISKALERGSHAAIMNHCMKLGCAIS